MYLSKFSREAVEDRCPSFAANLRPTSNLCAVSEYRDEPVNRLLQFAFSAEVRIRILINSGASEKR